MLSTKTFEGLDLLLSPDYVDESDICILACSDKHLSECTSGGSVYNGGVALVLACVDKPFYSERVY